MNLPKVKFDREDFHEFFSDASWAQSNANPPVDVNKINTSPIIGNNMNDDLRNLPLPYSVANSSAELHTETTIRGNHDVRTHGTISSIYNTNISYLPDRYRINDHSKRLCEIDFQDSLRGISERSRPFSPRCARQVNESNARYQETSYTIGIAAKPKCVSFNTKAIDINSKRSVIKSGKLAKEISPNDSHNSKIKQSSDIIGYDSNSHAKKQDKSLGDHEENYSNERLPPSPPLPQVLRKSKRTKITPLAYWRNERVVYSKASRRNLEPDSRLIHDINKIPLQEIADVIYVPETQKLNASRKKCKRFRKASLKYTKRRAKKYEYENDPDIEGSEWFKDTFLKADVFESNERMSRKIIAWAPTIGDFQLPTPNQDGSSTVEEFKVVSLFYSDSSSVAAGLLEFPSKANKSLRTAGESSFIFHVTRGIMEVTFNSRIFIVTKGCSFEVPRYNVYSFKNLGPGHARLFFVQIHIS